MICQACCWAPRPTPAGRHVALSRRNADFTDLGSSVPCLSMEPSTSHNTGTQNLEVLAAGSPSAGSPSPPATRCATSQAALRCVKQIQTSSLFRFSSGRADAAAAPAGPPPPAAAQGAAAGRPPAAASLQEWRRRGALFGFTAWQGKRCRPSSAAPPPTRRLAQQRPHALARAFRHGCLVVAAGQGARGKRHGVGRRGNVPILLSRGCQNKQQPRHAATYPPSSRSSRPAQRRAARLRAAAVSQWKVAAWYCRCSSGSCKWAS